MCGGDYMCLEVFGEDGSGINSIVVYSNGV